MYRCSDKNTCQSGAWQVKSVQRRSLWTQNSLSWFSVTYYRYIVLFEMQNHSARYRSSYPQREMIRNVNPQPCDKDIQHKIDPCVNCTSIFLLQCILKPFSIIVHSVSFSLSYTFVKWKRVLQEGKLSSLDLTLYTPSCIYIALLNECTDTDLKTITKDFCVWCTSRETHLGSLSKETPQTQLYGCFFFLLLLCEILQFPIFNHPNFLSFTWTPWESSCGRPLTAFAGTAASSFFSCPSGTTVSS